jgi:hypothetical protein
VVRSSHGSRKARGGSGAYDRDGPRTTSRGAVGGRLYFARARRSNESDRSSSRRSR